MKPGTSYQVRRGVHVPIAALNTIILFALTFRVACGQVVQDDFNRANSDDPGPGWMPIMDQASTPGLVIRNNCLTTPGAVSAGLCRLMPAQLPLKFSAHFTDMSGYYSRYRHTAIFSVLNDGTMAGGYQLIFTRSDQNYNNSSVILYDGSVNVGTLPSSFQFTAQASMTAQFNQDGSVTGFVTDGVSSFPFNFSARPIISKGQFFGIGLGNADMRTSQLILPTIDDVVVARGTPPPPSTVCNWSCSHFFQSDAGDTGPVPKSFATDQSTLKWGCALLTAASMLTSFGLDITPRSLDEKLKGTFVNGYDDSGNLQWENIPAAVAPAPVTFENRTSLENLTAAEVDSFLNDHFCGLQERVVLKLKHNEHAGDHFVFVTGKLANDWEVFDPGWKNPIPLENATTLSGHRTGFTTSTGKWSFKVVEAEYFSSTPKPSQFIGKVHSPVNLLVTDPQGKRIGFDIVSGTNVAEIPDAAFCIDTGIGSDDGDGTVMGDPSGVKSVYIPVALPGQYALLTTGIADGSYRLDFSVRWQGAGQLSQTTTGLAQVGISATQLVTVVSPSVIFKCSRNDKVFRLDFAGDSGASYSLQTCTNFAPWTWTDELRINTTSCITSVVSTNSSPSAVYRLKYVP